MNELLEFLGTWWPIFFAIFLGTMICAICWKIDKTKKNIESIYSNEDIRNKLNQTKIRSK